MIDYALKAKCVSLANTMTMREIYENVFKPAHSTMSYETFRHKLRDWKRKQFADEATLLCGTYPNFAANYATVQVNGKGKITQAWIKQEKEKVDWESIKNFITEGASSPIIPSTIGGKTMLEIPLFDLHFGIATLDYYKAALSDIISIILSKNYDEINVIIGQDVLHTNDMRGHTAKGTCVQEIDFTKAWKDAWAFFCEIINASLKHSPNVKLWYSKGNHDECSAWCFFKALEAIYPQCKCDDGLEPRKCILWNGCFVGFGHCEYTSKSHLLFQNFVLDFPKEFAEATVREIHSGHLHRESVDEGIVIRRLPSGVPTDNWSSNNGYVGAHKRFQLFEWSTGRLRSVFYV